MIPYGLTQEQFIMRYRRWLDKASAKLIEELRALFAAPTPSTVISAEVQIFLGDEGRGAPSAWIYFDGLNKKVDNSDTSIFPGRALEIQLGLEVMPDFDDRYFEINKFPGVELQANVVKAWFAECWWKAGGWAYMIPAKVAIHDDFGDGERIILTERSRRSG
jgi:hypothetical protein